MDGCRRGRIEAAFSTLLTVVGFALNGCGNAKPEAPRPLAQGSGGTGATAGAGGKASTQDVVLLPDGTGWVDRSSNELGVQGSWYPYGDQYGVAKCLNVGMHDTSECSHITAPLPPPATGFPNQGGKLCTSGATAVILPCKSGVMTSGCPDHDYSNMWGAGIGFDLNADGSTDAGTGAKHPYNPDEHGITGISFVLDAVPAPGFRVEFPQLLTDDEARSVNLPPGSTTDDHPDGAPYWGADAAFDNSPATGGVNVIHWDAVRKPGTTPSYVVDRSRLLGVQFHVPAVKSAPPGAYAFCVSEFTLLRE
jgi:hypothetical protein